jgi:hypothetical protein
MEKLEQALKRIEEAARREADLRQSILLESAQFEGGVDRIDGEAIAGWACDARHPGVKLSLDLLCDGKRLGSVFAEELRDDLAEAGKGDGRCAFSFPTPAGLRDGRVHLLEIKVAGTEVSLNGTPVRVCLAETTK